MHSPASYVIPAEAGIQGVYPRIIPPIRRQPGITTGAKQPQCRLNAVYIRTCADACAPTASYVIPAEAGIHPDRAREAQPRTHATLPAPRPQEFIMPLDYCPLADLVGQAYVVCPAKLPYSPHSSASSRRVAANARSPVSPARQDVFATHVSYPPRRMAPASGW